MSGDAHLQCGSRPWVPPEPAPSSDILKDHPSLREVTTSEADSSVVSETAEVLDHGATHAPPLLPPAPHRQALWNAVSAPVPTPTRAIQNTEDTPSVADTETLEPKQFSSLAGGIAERRGRRPIRLFVANRSDHTLHSEQVNFVHHGTPPELVHWPSEYSTPLPQYTSHVENYPVAQPSLRDVKRSLILSYVAQQQEARNEVKGGSNDLATPVREPPSYLSAIEPRLSAGKKDVSRTIEDALATPRPVASPGFRTLVLPMQLAKRSAKDSLLRPLLLPQDLEERSQYEVAARVVFRAERDSVNSGVSTSELGSSGSTSHTETAAKIEGILALLDDSGVMHSTPIAKACISIFSRGALGELHGSVASLASTYGTTPSSSSVFVSEGSRASLFLESREDHQTNWEDEIISTYCGRPVTGEWSCASASSPTVPRM